MRWVRKDTRLVSAFHLALGCWERANIALFCLGTTELMLSTIHGSVLSGVDVPEGRCYACCDVRSVGQAVVDALS